MTWRPSEQLQAQIRADIDSRYKERKRALELEHEEALREFEQWVSGETSGVPSPQKTSTTSSRNGLSVNGSSSSLTTRQMVMKVLPEFRGGIFTSGDIMNRIRELWPEISHRQIQTHIGQLLKEMSEEGKLDRFGKGPRVQDPWKYRIKEDQEETLLKSGP